MSEAVQNRAGVASDGGADIERIRQILFGERLRAYEERLTALEQALGQEQAGLLHGLDARLDRLERFCGGEFERLAERVGRLESGLAGESRTLQTHIAEQGGELDGLLARNREELLASLRREARRLSLPVPGNRRELAERLADLAVRLNGTFAVTLLLSYWTDVFTNFVAERSGAWMAAADRTE